MIRAIILILTYVVVCASLADGKYGPAVLAVIIAAVLLLMGSVERRDTKAWNNRQEYWARGGPDRRK